MPRLSVATEVGTLTGPGMRSPLNDNLGGRFDLTTTVTGAFSSSLTLGARAKISFTKQPLLSQVRVISSCAAI